MDPILGLLIQPQQRNQYFIGTGGVLRTDNNTDSKEDMKVRALGRTRVIVLGHMS